MSLGHDLTCSSTRPTLYLFLYLSRTRGNAVWIRSFVLIRPLDDCEKALIAMNPLKLVQKFRNNFYGFGRLTRELNEAHDLILADNTRKRQLSHPNPLNAFGKKCFSQSDEDGITLEILRRLDSLEGGVYAEYGVGNGMENNTLILAALGWRGFWVGGQKLLPNIADGRGDKFQYAKCWITLENIMEVTKDCLLKIRQQQVDVISLDLDGNNIYFIRRILEAGLRPKLFIAEYNAKFPPPVKFSVPYESERVWQGDDYYGASLSSLDELFSSFNYQLVCCNSHSGSNAFFVDKKFSGLFCDVPADIEKNFVGPRHALYRQYGNKSSARTIERIFDVL